MDSQKTGEDQIREHMILGAVERVGGIGMSASDHECLRVLGLEGQMSAEQFNAATYRLKNRGAIRAPLDYDSSATVKQYMFFELVGA